MILADTSVWVEFLRRGNAGRARELRGLILRDEVVMCGPVAAELLKGVDPSERDELWTTLVSLEWQDLGREAWRRIGEAAAALRRRGETLPLIDIAIAVAAVTSDAVVWTADSDFDRIGAVLAGFKVKRFR